MKVRMLMKITGTRNGVELPDIGGTLDVPDDEAESLIRSGYAEKAEEPKQEAKSKK